MSDWPPIAGAAFAIALICIGLLSWYGRWRNWAVLRQNDATRRLIGAGPSTLIPGAVVILLFILSGVLAGAGGVFSLLGLILFIVSLIGMVVSFHMMLWPPRWLKPRWLVEEEEGDRSAGLFRKHLSSTASQSGTAVRPTPLQLSPRQYALGWVAAGLFLVMWWVFSWPASLLLGLAGGVSMLVSLRPQSRGIAEVHRHE